MAVVGNGFDEASFILANPDLASDRHGKQVYAMFKQHSRGLSYISEQQKTKIPPSEAHCELQSDVRVQAIILSSCKNLEQAAGTGCTRIYSAV